jgi:3-oxoacyl-[acyl-carrier protein] reductase
VAVVGLSDQHALAETTHAVTVLGRDTLALTTDVAQQASAEYIVQQVLKRWERIDILVNNAGVIHPNRLEEISAIQWQRTLAVHLTGTFNCTQAVVPTMKAQGGGKIINVAAPSALRGTFGVADYAAAKGGIVAFTRNVAVELKAYNIQVNCISPVAQTRMTEALEAFRSQRKDETMASSGRIKRKRADPEAVTPAFVFFACADSDYITGQLLAVDGGGTA